MRALDHSGQRVLRSLAAAQVCASDKSVRQTILSVVRWQRLEFAFGAWGRHDGLPPRTDFSAAHTRHIITVFDKIHETILHGGGKIDGY